VTAYADTSWWIAYKWRRDRNHEEASSFFDSEEDIQVMWTPWQRVEVFISLRQLERGGLMRAGESQPMIASLENEVRLGYWPHQEFRWTEAVRTAVDLSQQHGLRLPLRGMDVFHVAIAIVSRAENFLSFDKDQNALALAAGLQAKYAKS
jgi:predicted nucleic acid-binding protein